MAILKNDKLEVELNAKGAEIIHILGQQDQINYMWKRDPKLWANSAPVLFPIVGALQNNQCRIDGQVYEMTQHGFARHSIFDENIVSDEKVEYILTSNENIIKQYPYLFKLIVTYTLKENKLHCSFKVINEDKRPIYFQIGGHPAFACPFYDDESSNDYYLEFSQNESLTQKIIDVEHKGMSQLVEPLFDNERRFFVRQAMFDNDAIVVKNFQSESVSLKSLNHNKSIVFHMNGFPHLGLWASKHVGGLLAIEPWVGHSDYVDFQGEFKEKEDAVELKPQQIFECEFIVEINQ